MNDVKWGFAYYTDGPMMKACDKAARRAAREWEEMEYEDAYQEALIWLATHPDIQDRFTDGGYDGVNHLAQQIYANCLRDLCIKESYGGMTGLPYDKNRNLSPALPGTFEALPDE